MPKRHGSTHPKEAVKVRLLCLCNVHRVYYAKVCGCVPYNTIPLNSRRPRFVLSGENVVVVTSSSPLITRSEAIQQLRQDIMEFYDAFKEKYQALRRKHVKELRELRRLSGGKRSNFSVFERFQFSIEINSCLLWF